MHKAFSSVCGDMAAGFLDFGLFASAVFSTPASLRLGAGFFLASAAICSSSRRFLVGVSVRIAVFLLRPGLVVTLGAALGNGRRFSKSKIYKKNTGELKRHANAKQI
jgi:hypothetical protein